MTSQGSPRRRPSGAHAYLYTVVAVDAAGNPSAQSPSHTIVLDPGAVSAPTSVTAVASPTSQAPQLTWGAPTAPLFTVAPLQRLSRRAGTPVGVVIGATTFTDTTPNLADGSYTYQVVAAAGDGDDSASRPRRSPSSMTRRRPRRRAVSLPTPRSTARSASRWAAPRATAPARASRATSCAARCPSSPPASAADGDAICQGLVDLVHRRDRRSTASSTAMRSSRSTRAGNTSLAGTSPAVTARDQLAPGRAERPAPRLRATRASPCAGRPPGADDDVAGYVLVAKPGSAGADERHRRHARLHGDRGDSTACSATGLTNGATYTFGLFALDEALNRSQPRGRERGAQRHVSDTKAPAAVTKLKAKVSGHKVTLTWKNPADQDFDHVEITAGERKPAALKAAKRVYSGKGTKATITLAAGPVALVHRGRLRRVGNASPPASVHVASRPRACSAPRRAPRCTARSGCSWPVAKGARYYNVQLYAGKKRIFVSWPDGPRAAAARAPSSSAARSTPGTSGRASARRPRRATAS